MCYLLKIQQYNMQTMNDYQIQSFPLSQSYQNMMNDLSPFFSFEIFSHPFVSQPDILLEENNVSQLTSKQQTNQQSQPKENIQNIFDDMSVSYYHQNSRIIADNQQKKHKKKEKPDDDDYMPLKRKKQQLGKNFLPNFTKPFLNLLKDELTKNNIKSQVFTKHQKLEALNWKILQEFFQESQLHLPILNIFMKNVKLQCLLSKTKQKKILMEHFKQLRKLKNRLIFILEKKVRGTNNENEQFRYSKGYIRGQIPMDS